MDVTYQCCVFAYSNADYGAMLASYRALASRVAALEEENKTLNREVRKATIRHDCAGSYVLCATI